MKKPQPIDCEQALARIFEFIDHELKAHEREAMQHHLQTCKSCYSRVEFERRLMGKLKELRDTETSVTARGRIEKLLKSL
jgi:anti-sigma factor (TIGR02949 family)